MANGEDKEEYQEQGMVNRLATKGESILSKLGGAVSDATSELSKGSTFSRFSKGVKDFYKPITDAIKPKPIKKPITNLKSNIPGDLEVTYDKDGYAINPNPFEINKETGKARVKSDHFTQNSTILPEIEILSSKTSKPSEYEALRESMPKPTGPNYDVEVERQKERKDLEANKQQMDKMNNDKDVVTNYKEKDKDYSLQNLENKF